MQPGKGPASVHVRPQQFLLLVVAITLLISGVGATTARANAPDGFFGVNVQQVFSGPSSAWQPHLAAMESGGLQTARIDARWAIVEPNPPSGGTHSYNWSMYDGIVQGLAQHGLRWLPIVAYSTDWSTSVPGNTNAAILPSRIPDFAAYAAALARRYGRNGTFWQSHSSLPYVPVTDYEIWNEENSTVFWQPQAGNAEEYADLYAAARSGIRGADGQARVFIGGLALNNPPDVTDEVDFVRRMFAHRPDLAGNVDGVGLHPYQRTVADTYMRIARFRQGLDTITGPNVPIEITEVGWATTAVSDAERGADLAQLAQDLPRSDCNIDRFLPYTWMTEESNPSDPESWFGIWNRDGSPRASGQGYLGAVQLMRSSSAPGGTVPICSTDYSSAPKPAPAITPHPPKGPRLILRVQRKKHRPFVIVRAQCRKGCQLNVDLMARKPHKNDFRTRVSRKATKFSTRRQLIHLRIPKKLLRQKHAQVVVTAVGQNGAATVAARKVRIH
jgi:hypothetical protein